MNGCRPLCIPVAIVVVIDVAIVVAVALLSRPGFPCAGPQRQDYAADGGSIGLSGKGPAYLPTRGKLRIGADILKVAGGVIYSACGGTPAGNLGSNHPNRQQPKQPRKPKQPGIGRPSKHIRAEYLELKYGCSDGVHILVREEIYVK